MLSGAGDVTRGGRTAVLFALLFILLDPGVAGGQPAGARQGPVEGVEASPTLASLADRVVDGKAAAVPEFWREIERTGTPLVEPDSANPGWSIVSFVARGGAGVERMRLDSNLTALLVGDAFPLPDDLGWMERLEETDVWYLSFRLRDDVRVPYKLATYTGAGDPSVDVDPHNPEVWEPGVEGLRASILELPGAPPQPWRNPSGDEGRGDWDELSADDGSGRSVYVYKTPAWEEDRDAPHPVLIGLGAFGHGVGMRVDRMVDELVETGRLPPLVVALVDLTRDDEATRYRSTASFLIEELVPYLRATYGVSEDPDDVVVSGTSRRGMVAALLALEHPDVFGNVLSLSGSYYWSPADVAAYEWVPRRYAESERRPVDFYVAAGELETVVTPGNRGHYLLATNRHMRDVLVARGYDLEYLEFNGVHSELNWQDWLAEGLTRLLGGRVNVGADDIEFGLAGVPNPDRMPEIVAEEAGFWVPVAGDSVRAFEGRVEVPLVRSDPSAGTIDLRYVRFPATTANPGPPIVYLAGGPGGSGINAFRGRRQSFFLGLRDVADVVAFDQRGTGDSGPEGVVCEHERGLPRDRPGSRAAYLGVIRAEVERCLGAFRERGIDPAGFTTAENADDVEALRRALGAPRLSLLGSSYGTHLALAVLRRHPDAVDRVVLAGVEGPDHTIKLPGNVERNLEDLAAVARTDSLYAGRLPDLVGTIDSLREALAEEPRAIELLDGAVVVGAWDLQEYVASFVGSRDRLAGLPAAVYALVRGSWTDFGRWVDRRRAPGSTHAMSLATDCASFASPERLAQIRAESPGGVADAAIDFPLPEICDVTGLPRLGAEFRAPLQRDTPALFISGTLDGRTPLSNARAVANGFSQGRELVVEGSGHGADLYQGSHAIERAVRGFFRGEAPPERLVLPGFVLDPPHERSLAADVLARLERDGFDATVEWYLKARDADATGRTYDWSEGELNALGYDLLGADRVDLAVEVFRLNVMAHPEAYNPWDSLGEAYMNAGDIEKAIEAYQKSLELNPGNANARRMVARLRGG